MRRLGPVALTGAERTRRWRQRRFDQKVAERVAVDLDTLPPDIRPTLGERVIRAWRARAFRYAITPAQWSVFVGITDPRAADVAEQAIREAPRLGPASLVWRAVMERLADLRPGVMRALRPAAIAHALRLTDSHPQACATCGRAPSVRYHDGTWGFPCTHAPIRDVPRGPVAPQYPPEDSPGMRAWRAVGESLRKYPKA